MRELTDNEIVQRVDMMDRWMKRFRDQDIAASRRYRDVNALAGAATDDWDFDEDGFEPEGGNVPAYVPVGQPNWLSINIVTKLAAIAMGDPDLHVKAQEDDQQPNGVKGASLIVAKAWKQSWINGNWKRETNAGLLKRYIGGLGAIAYRWDAEYGPCFEHVPSWRLLIDPHVTNWQRLEMGGYKVKMPLRKALERYDPNGENEFFGGIDILKEDSGINLDKEVVSINIYFDKRDEVHTYKSKVVHRSKNLYEKVPLLIIEGDIDPTDNVFPLGDSVLAAGLQQALTDLTSIALNTAKHGGPITTYDPQMFDDGAKNALADGSQQAMIPIKQNNPQAPAIMRYAGEQLAPAFMDARREMQYALDGVTAVTPGDRGEQIPNVTATQSVMVENKQGARPTQARADYEAWMNRLATAYVELMQKFGGPTEDDEGTTEQKVLWQAFKAVYEVKVVEGSTTYKNPGQDQQQTMQLFVTMSDRFEQFVANAAAGLSDKVPNMVQYADDMLRSFSRQNIDQYWVSAPKDQGGGPNPDIIKALASIFKLLPLPERMQAEKLFGLEPSGQIVQEAGGAAPEDPDIALAAEANKRAMQEDQQAHEGAMQAAKHHHETEMQKMNLGHEAEVKAAEMGHQAQMGAMQAETQSQLADKNNEAKEKQARAKPKPTSDK